MSSQLTRKGVAQDQATSQEDEGIHSASSINISDKVRREERNTRKIIQVKPEEEKGLGNGKITISNNNDIEDTRNVIRNTTKRGDKSKR